MSSHANDGRCLAVTDTYEYDAFGNALVTTGSTPNEFLYRGEQFDPDLGLYYLRARYYNPATGRFMSRDPEDGNGYDPETLHKFLYAGGNPINGIDPTGRAAYIESIFSRSVVSSELEITVTNYGRLVADGICGIAKFIRTVTQQVQPGMLPLPWYVVPSIKALAILCTATGF